MASQQTDTSWIWHPSFTETRTDTAGLFVHFRKKLLIKSLSTQGCRIHISADTRYKLYVNRQLAGSGPVKGDANLWFYDELDLTPFLKIGQNDVGIQVLRFFHATAHATSFPRLPLGGLMIRGLGDDTVWTSQIRGSTSWETAVDQSIILPVDQVADHFLHVYERSISSQTQKLKWVPAVLHRFQSSTGLGPPWNLSTRLIPPSRREEARFSAVHNLDSYVSQSSWEAVIVRSWDTVKVVEALRLAAGTSHHIELEVEHHMTASLQLRFKRSQQSGSTVKLTYAESYEDPPRLEPWLRSKGNRCDTTKSLYGPQDFYTLRSQDDFSKLDYYLDETTEETITPFHFRTFRFIGIDINVGASDLVLRGIDLEMVNYPLDVIAEFKTSESKHMADKLWEASILTLRNCMHDCYEDCPFYEQLQYAMDTRSSALFTYCVSGDDRLARQAMLQIHNSFQARLGLTDSRTPSHQTQIIPHFSLFWICMLSDHLTFFGDKPFIRQFLAVVDGVLEYFNARVDPAVGLVASCNEPGIWNFVDWTDSWRPYGIPPAAERTGFSTYTNNMYAYTLNNAATILKNLGRMALADEYTNRAATIVRAIQLHCFDGQFFTDGLASAAVSLEDYSQHNQVWSILSGAVSGKQAREILQQALDPTASQNFVQASIAQSIYTLRALSIAGGEVYDAHFHAFWNPWRAQLALGLTTWEEDSVSQRSDCHAWGSAPIHEFMVEVAGVRPAKIGWTEIEFQPRVTLFRDLDAKVPFKIAGTQRIGIACVQWTTAVSGEVRILLTLEGCHGIAIPVHVRLPGQEARVVSSADTMAFSVGDGHDAT